VWTGRVLRDFLAQEPEWTKLDELRGRTAIFRKDAEIDPDELWTEQRYVMRKTGIGLPTMARQSVSMIRAARAASSCARRVRAWGASATAARGRTESSAG
jgi:hypothetical protein